MDIKRDRKNMGLVPEMPELEFEVSQERPSLYRDQYEKELGKPYGGISGLPPTGLNRVK